MQRKTRRRWLWISIVVALLTAAAVVPLLLTADSGQITFTATLYSDVIRFEADGAASLRVQVFDLAENELWSSGLVLGDIVDWDRTNARGERLANGYYLYLAQGWDASDTLILNKAGKVVLLPGNQVELRAAPVVGAVVGSGDDPVMSPMLHTIADDLQVDGTITATESGSNTGSLAIQAGPSGNRARFTLTGYAAGASGDFASFIMRTDNQDAVFSVKDVSADTWHSAFDFEYLNAVFDFKGNEVNNVGQLGIGTTSPTQQLEITGNLKLPYTTASAGAIYIGNAPFLHGIGYGNVCLGHSAGSLTMTGQDNTAIGLCALNENSTGGRNTAVGYAALGGEGFTGNRNTAVGAKALESQESGNYNIALGYRAGEHQISGSMSIYIGSQGQPAESNTIRIGNSTDHTHTYLQGPVTIEAYTLPDTDGANGQVLATNGSGNVSWQTVSGGGATWSLAGNAGTTPGTNFLGTTDDQALQLHVNGNRALRIEPHATSPNLIGGQSGNSVASGAHGATIGGGGESAAGNHIYDHYGVIGGGSDNSAGTDDATMDGAMWATIGGGEGNTAFAHHTTVGGGEGNSAVVYYATVSGGAQNSAIKSYDTVAGGSGNQAMGNYSTVSGGGSNTTSGSFSVVPGGCSNTAAGNNSFAAGYSAKANHQGAFVWADSGGGPPGVDFASTTNDEFSVRATGGSRFVTAVDGSGNPTAGVKLEAGDNAWSSISDVTLKENVAPINKQGILEALADLPVTEWNMKAQDPSIRHIGPMAQDFYGAFGLGANERYINSSDADGIALVSIQALYELLLQKDIEIEELEKKTQEIDELQARMETLEQAVEAMKD